MLKKLTLVNFRSHKNTVIEFSEGVNVIVGRGQAGKTNIKRALEWLCTNRPRGDKVHSYWCEKGDVTSVEAETTEGYVITISKALGDSVEFSLCHPEGSKAQWGKTNSQVPDKILEALNICDLNIQNQLDQPYLITAGTGEVSRAVNQAVDLDHADLWATELNKRRKQNKSTITTLKGQLEKTKYQLDGYTCLPEIEQLIKEAAIVRDAYNKKVNNRAELDLVISKITVAEKYLAKLEGVETLEGLMGAVLTTQAVRSKIEKNQDAIGRILSDVGASNHIIGKVEALKLIDQTLCKITRMSNRFSELEGKAKQCEAVVFAAEEVEMATEDLLDESNQYAQLLDELGVCPTCFTPVDDETLSYVIDGLTD